MEQKVLLESEFITDSINIVRRHLYPDTPVGNVIIESHLLEELTALLKIFFKVEDFYVGDDLEERYEFYRECFEQFEEFRRSRLYQTLTQFHLVSIEVRNLNGTTILTFIK